MDNMPELSAEETEAEQIKKYYQRFRKSLTGVQPKHDLWKVLDTFDRGEQWKDASIPPWVPKPVTNYIRYVRTLKRANLASEIPKADFHPVNMDQAMTVRRAVDGYEHVWQQEHVNRLIRRCIDRAVLQGTAIAYIYTDETHIGGRYYGKNNPKNRLYKGKIGIKRFANANFFPDPDAYRIEDCKYIDTTELQPLSVVKNTPAFKKYAGKRLAQLNGNLMERETDAAGAIYARDTSPLDNTQYILGDEMVVVHAHWERYMDNQGKWHLDVTYYVRNTDFALLVLKDIQPNEYPFAVLYDEEEENDFWGTSECMGILENQKVMNKVDQTASIIGVLHQNPQKVVARESGINAQELARSGTLPGKVWTTNTDPTKSIHHLEPPDIPKGLFELSDRMKESVKETVGTNEAYTGGNTGSLTTSTGVNTLIERSTMRDKDKMIAIDEFVERLSNLIILFVMHKWQDKRPLMTLNADGTPDHSTFVPFTADEINNLEWFVKSDVYTHSPMTQSAKRQQADHLLQVQGQFQFDPPILIPEEWVQMQDFFNKDQILSRMQEDRAKKEAKEQQNLAHQITQVAQIIQQHQQQGENSQKVQQEALQYAQELLAEADKAKAQGKEPMANTPTAPKGATGSVAMQAMAKGH